VKSGQGLNQTGGILLNPVWNKTSLTLHKQAPEQAWDQASE